MQLDHINGIHSDNRLENLRILCPNCHSQTDTFCRNKYKKDNISDKEERKKKDIIFDNEEKIKIIEERKKKEICPDCNSKKSLKAIRCKKCSDKHKGYNCRKVKNRPSNEILKKEVEESSYVSVGKKYGVSDNTIRKWLK